MRPRAKGARRLTLLALLTAIALTIFLVACAVLAVRQRMGL